MGLLATPALIPGTAESSITTEYVWDAKRKLRCYFDLNDPETYVRTNLGAGYTMYSAHPNDPWLLITSIHVADQGEIRSHPDFGNCREWHADITYGLWTPLLNSLTGNPVDRPPLYRFACTRIEKVADTDSEGNPIVNSVGDPYNPPLPKDATSVIFVVTQNQATPDFGNILVNWVDHINTSDWGWFPARTLKLCPVNLPERLFSQVSGQLYYPMEFQFEFNPDTWDKKVLNQGFREIDPADSTGSTLRNVMIEGQPATEPVLLSAAGAFQEPPVNKDDVVFNIHKIYGDFNFSDMGLDAVFTTNNSPQGGS